MTNNNQQYKIISSKIKHLAKELLIDYVEAAIYL